MGREDSLSVNKKRENLCTNRQPDGKRLTRDELLSIEEYIMELYVRNGFKELSAENLPTLIGMKYHSTADALAELKMQPQQVRGFYLDM